MSVAPGNPDTIDIAAEGMTPQRSRGYDAAAPDGDPADHEWRAASRDRA